MFNNDEVYTADLFAPISFGSGGGGGGGGSEPSPRSGPQTANSTSHNPPGVMGFDFNDNGSVMDEAAAGLGLGAAVATGGIGGVLGAGAVAAGYGAASGL